jgi:hypothetical protein
MALTASELQRVRFETGYNVLSAGAEPYISYVAVFDKVIQQYINGAAKTTSATPVAASTAFTPATLTLADPTGFTAFDRVVVDVDDRLEVATPQSLSGASLTLLLRRPHSGTYPISVESGETIVREKLRQILIFQGELTASPGTGALKQVDEIQFYGVGERSGFAVARSDLMALRDELAGALGVANLWRERTGGGGIAVNY